MTAQQNQINREALIKLASLVRPALAAQAYIPALTHIKFDGSYASAYNDVSMISVRAEVDLAALVPGELLIKALSSFTAESLVIQDMTKEKAIVVSSGRSKLKIPVLDLDAFPFEVPNMAKANSIKLSPAILKGIEHCLLSVGSDPTHPARMGITLDVDTRGNAILYSTDSFTVSRYRTKTKIKLPGDSPIILPTFFCQQAIALAKTYPSAPITLLSAAGALMIELGEEATLFSKTLVDVEPLDFPKLFDKHCKVDQLENELFPIPDSWDAAFNRAMLVLGGELDKVTQVTMTPNSLKLHSTSSMGDSDESMAHALEDVSLPDPVLVDPVLVLRISKVCSQMYWTPAVLVLADSEADFVHLIAYCSR